MFSKIEKWAPLPWSEYVEKQKKTCLEVKIGKDILKTNGKAIYLGVILNSRWSFYDNLKRNSENSNDLYARVKRISSANWGIQQEAVVGISAQDNICSNDIV